ncbi:Allene oxide synthase, chloroplastic [Apostasia shenzhenica]|uniref:Allene oxide synthase, chloroplastic n=1 Tax=Apostasia shenzhenica TaxID=1088818 RepID=A0A2H9ZTI0_9ASPA|nr:Allene oxide synthase, chloroplastic [Apostasia shenzhenica]
MISSFTSMATSVQSPPSSTSIRQIPGGYGLPVLGPLKDRLDYFWFQGQDKFFRSRMDSLKSTVFRTNIPPTFPFFLGVDPRIIAVVDCSSFSALFDPSLVDKRDVLVGSYMPSLRFTGNTRVGVYLDTTEPGHSAIKNFCIDLLRRSSSVWVSSFLSNLDAMLSSVESELSQKQSAGFLFPLQKCIFAFLCKSIVGADPAVSPEVGDGGFAMLDRWIVLQLLPTVGNPALPQPLAEIFLHSFPFPFFLVAGDYRKLHDFVAEHGQEVVGLAEREYGLGKEEAINNILFVLGFNAFGGFSIFLPKLITTIGRDNTGLKSKLRDEVRREINENETLGFEEVKRMELLRSTVYEVLRLNPPVPLQFARAREDFELTSAEARFQVKKGELLCGYQPLAMRDAAVFERADEFLPERFLGEEGKERLKYLFWSNGPETETPAKENKQCAAKEHVVATACLMVAEMFRRYDDFECDEGNAFTKLEKARNAVDAAAAAAVVKQNNQ